VTERRIRSTIATLQYSGSTSSTNRTVSLGNGGGTISVSNSASTILTESGTITGASGLTKTGSGTLALSGANDYTGDTTLSGGTLSLGSRGAIGTVGTINFAGGTLQFSPNNTTDYSGRFSNAVSQAYNIDTNGQSVTLASNLTSSGGTLTKLGNGTLTLTGSNAYSGSTTVSGGTLSGATIADSGTNSVFGQGNFSIANTATLQYTGGTVSTNRTVSLGTGGGAIDVPTGTATLTVSGVISGAGGLTKTGSGTLALSGANSYSGGTTISGGIVTGNTIANNGGPSAFGQQNFTISNGATLQYTGSTITVGRSISLGSGGGTIDIPSAATALTIGGTISGTGDLTKTGPGTLLLTSGTSSCTGLFTVSAGMLSGGTIANNGTSSSFGQGNFSIANGATLQYSGGSASTNRTILLGSGGGIFSVSNAGAVTLIESGVISGTGGLTKAGPATLSLTGVSDYSGDTTVSAGTLLGNSIADNGTNSAFGRGNLSIANGATLQYTGSTASTNRTVSLGSGGSTISVIAGTTLTENGNITGTGALTKANTGTLALTGANDYAGGTTISGGILALGSSSAIGTAGTISFTGGTLQFSASNTTDYSSRFSSASSQAYSIDTNGQSVSLASNLNSSTGTLTKLGAGTLTLSGSSAYAGATTVSAGTLSGNTIAANGTNSAFGRGNFSIANNATLEYTGGSASTNRTVLLGSGGGTISVTGSSTMLTVSNIISGTAAGLTKAGAGTLSTTATNTYSGNTTVSGGTLSITHAYLADAADVYLSTGSIFNLNFAATDTIRSLYLNGVGQATGTWGGTGSGAAHTTALITGTGLLNVTTMPPLTGDFNGNGVVDAADYVSWRKGLGTIYSQSDYNAWRSNFGQTAGSGSEASTNAAVPEPASALLLLVGILAICPRRRVIMS
jgi:autotransporter-associated beta strand protein